MTPKVIHSCNKGLTAGAILCLTNLVDSLVRVNWVSCRKKVEEEESGGGKWRRRKVAQVQAHQDSMAGMHVVTARCCG